MRLPRARAMNSGSPPTARNARTGELTPPGSAARARWPSSRDLLVSFGSIGFRLLRPGLAGAIRFLVGDAFFLGQRLRLAFGLRRQHGGIDLLALLFFRLGQPLDGGDHLAFVEA